MISVLEMQMDRMRKIIEVAVKNAVEAERARCLDIANNYADIEGDSEHIRPNTAMRIAMEISGESAR